MDKETARDRLLARLAELDEEDRISAADREPVQLDQDSVGWLSRVDAMQMQEMALAAQRRRVSERQRIAAALDRLDTEEFGYCLSCGEKINPARLEHDPSASQCLACASGDKG